MKINNINPFIKEWELNKLCILTCFFVRFRPCRNSYIACYAPVATQTKINKKSERKCTTYSIPIPKQKGAVLATSLIILMIVTVLGVSVMKTNILEEKMVNNDRRHKEALHIAELALREGESEIDPDFDYSNVITTTSSTSGFYLASAAPSDGWWNKDGGGVDWDNAVQVKTSTSAIDNPAKYIVEQLPIHNSTKDSIETGTVQTRKYYRVTSRALIPGTKAKVMLQTTFIK